MVMMNHDGGDDDGDMVIMVGDDGDDDCEVDTNARSPAPQGYSAGAEMRRARFALDQYEG